MNNDLIIRKALKDKLTEIINVDDITKIEWYCVQVFSKLIDNAPTVETFTKEDMAGAYNEGYACGSRESERPKGETSVCQNPKGNCFTCKLFEVCEAKTKPADMRGNTNEVQR